MTSPQKKKSMTNQSNLAELPTVCFKEISNWVNSMLNLDQLLELIIDTAARMMQAKAGSLLLYDEKRNKLYFKVATGEKSEEVRKFEVNMGEGISGYVAQKGKPLLVPDVKKDPRWDKTISEMSGFETTSIACVPLKIDERIIGVVEVVDKEDGSPIRQEDLNTLTVIADLASTAIVNARTIDRFKRENQGLKEELSTRYKIIGESRSLKKAVSEALKVAHTKTSTLVLGESGTGKEVLAKLIHHAGPRNSMPMVMVNCAALPETLLESELFGHEKGAFTGAAALKKGRFELADKGTLFLDEIGELPMPLQVKLLRVLQEKTIDRVGGTTPIPVDFRLIAATNKTLEEEVAKKRFREDLYYRLNVVKAVIPPLRERPEDIPLLMNHFIKKFTQESESTSRIKGISKDAAQILCDHPWSGNVRELENVIERSVILAPEDIITSADLPPHIRQTSGSTLDLEGIPEGVGLAETLTAVEKRMIIRAMNLSGNVQTKAAQILGIGKSGLNQKLKKYNLDKELNIKD